MAEPTPLVTGHAHGQPHEGAVPGPAAVRTTDRAIGAFMQRSAIPMARLGLAVVFVWFGWLKVVGASPATGLVERTVTWADPSWFIPLLGWWEVAIGVCLLDPWRMLGGRAWLTRIGIALMFAQMPGTFLPLVTVPDACWSRLGVPTLEGQYIIKNLVLIAAALAVGASVLPHDAARARARRGADTLRAA